MNSVAAGLLSLGVIATGTYLGFTKDIPLVNEPYEVKAAFSDGSGMKPGSPVRIAGVEVGQVTEVEHTSPGASSITATMTIRDRGRPVHTDAEATIRPRIFLEGNFYIDLSPGTPGAPELAEGQTIPATQTSQPVQVGEVLRILKHETRRDLKSALSSLAEAQEAGAGKAFNRTLRFQAPAYKYSAIVSEALLGRRPGDLARWIRAQGTVSAALDRHPRELKDLITSFNATAGALADREADLRRVVGELGPTLEEALPALAALNASFPSVRRFAREALPAVRSSRPSIRAQLPLLHQLRRLVREDELQGLAADLRRLTPDATRLARTSVPVLEQARLLAGCTSEVLVPWGNDTVPDPNFPASGPVHEELPKALPGLAGESRSFDANGQWFRVFSGGGPHTFDFGNNLFGTFANPIAGVNPPPDRTRPPLRPGVPCETQQPPDLRTRQGPPPRSVENDPATPAARERHQKARALAIAVMQARLRQAGKDVVVRDDDIRLDELREVARRNGLTEQMHSLQKRAAHLGRRAAEARR